MFMRIKLNWVCYSAPTVTIGPIVTDGVQENMSNVTRKLMDNVQTAAPAKKESKNSGDRKNTKWTSAIEIVLIVLLYNIMHIV